MSLPFASDDEDSFVVLSGSPRVPVSRRRGRAVWLAAAGACLICLHSWPVYKQLRHACGFHDSDIFAPNKVRASWDGDAYVFRGRSWKPDVNGVVEVVSLPLKGSLGLQKGYILLQSNPKNAPTIVYFYGTRSNIALEMPNLEAMFSQLGANVICVDYRGVGGCPGTVNEQTMHEDAERILKHVGSKLKDRVDLSNLFVAGHSLGTNAALHVASCPRTRRLLKGVMLFSPPTTVREVAKSRLALPDYYLRWCFPDMFDNCKMAVNVDAPVFLCACTDDSITPIVMCSEVFDAMQDAAGRYAVVLDGAKHSNAVKFLSALPDMKELMLGFLNGDPESNETVVLPVSAEVSGDDDGEIRLFTPLDKLRHNLEKLCATLSETATALMPATVKDEDVVNQLILDSVDTVPKTPT